MKIQLQHIDNAIHVSTTIIGVACMVLLGMMGIILIITNNGGKSALIKRMSNLYISMLMFLIWVGLYINIDLLPILGTINRRWDWELFLKLLQVIVHAFLFLSIWDVFVLPLRGQIRNVIRRASDKLKNISEKIDD